MLAKSGVVLAGLARAARGAAGSRDLCAIFDKTIDECAEAMPADVTLTVSGAGDANSQVLQR